MRNKPSLDFCGYWQLCAGGLVASPLAYATSVNEGLQSYDYQMANGFGPAAADFFERYQLL